MGMPTHGRHVQQGVAVIVSGVDILHFPKQVAVLLELFAVLAPIA